MNGGERRRQAKALFMSIATRYPMTEDGVRQLIQDPEWRKEFPDSKLYPGGELALDVIDVVMSSVEKK